MFCQWLEEFFFSGIFHLVFTLWVVGFPRRRKNKVGFLFDWEQTSIWVDKNVIAWRQTPPAFIEVWEPLGADEKLNLWFCVSVILLWCLPAPVDCKQKPVPGTSVKHRCPLVFHWTWICWTMSWALWDSPPLGVLPICMWNACFHHILLTKSCLCIRDITITNLLWMFPFTSENMTNVRKLVQCLKVTQNRDIFLVYSPNLQRLVALELPGPEALWLCLKTWSIFLLLMPVAIWTHLGQLNSKEFSNLIVHSLKKYLVCSEQINPLLWNQLGAGFFWRSWMTDPHSFTLCHSAPQTSPSAWLLGCRVPVLQWYFMQECVYIFCALSLAIFAWDKESTD